MKKIVLVGAGGHCKVIIDIIKSIGEYEVIGITDPQEKGNVLAIPILGDDDILPEIFQRGIKHAFVCMGSLDDISLRNKIICMLKNIGFELPVLTHKAAVISPFSTIKEGSCVMAGVIINPGTVIRENCIINTGSVIEHDCTIGYNTHISPNSSIAGNVNIGCNTHIGIGSTIIQGVNIGSNVTVGAGAVVINNICDNSLAVGIPAKIIRSKQI